MDKKLRNNFLSAILHHDLKYVKHLTENGINVNQDITHYGFPLRIAVQYCAINIASYFLDKGADINATSNSRTNYFSPAIHLAAFHLQHRMIDLLHSRNAMMNTVDSINYTPLIMSIKQVDARDRHKYPLVYEANLSNTISVMSKLINCGADINFINAKGETPILAAALMETPEILQFLLDEGATPNPQQNSKETSSENKIKNPLLRAIANNLPGNANLLLSRGAKIPHNFEYFLNFIHDTLALNSKDASPANIDEWKQLIKQTELMQKRGIATIEMTSPAYEIINATANLASTINPGLTKVAING